MIKYFIVSLVAIAIVLTGAFVFPLTSENPNHSEEIYVLVEKALDTGYNFGYESSKRGFSYEEGLKNLHEQLKTLLKEVAK